MKKILYILFLFISGSISAQELHLYGGENRDIYLGCLNANKYNSTSVWNTYGTYGNTFSSYSIWNKHSTFGNPYSQYSPWNKYALYPPAILDEKGNFLGYFTLNQGKQRVKTELTNYIYEYHEDIKENITRWYDRIFKY